MDKYIQESEVTRVVKMLDELEQKEQKRYVRLYKQAEASQSEAGFAELRRLMSNAEGRRSAFRSAWSLVAEAADKARAHA